MSSGGIGVEVWDMSIPRDGDYMCGYYTSYTKKEARFRFNIL